MCSEYLLNSFTNFSLAVLSGTLDDVAPQFASLSSATCRSVCVESCLNALQCRRRCWLSRSEPAKCVVRRRRQLIALQCNSLCSLWLRHFIRRRCFTFPSAPLKILRPTARAREASESESRGKGRSKGWSSVADGEMRFTFTASRPCNRQERPQESPRWPLAVYRLLRISLQSAIFLPRARNR